VTEPEVFVVPYDKPALELLLADFLLMLETFSDGYIVGPGRPERAFEIARKYLDSVEVERP
jgi:hypothetical protein